MSADRRRSLYNDSVIQNNFLKIPRIKRYVSKLKGPFQFPAKLIKVTSNTPGVPT